MSRGSCSPRIEGALLKAASDARYLLGRGYPREVVLKLVGDRWGLEATQREFIRRGVFAPGEAARRRAKLVGLGAVEGREVWIDGHNVLITIESALAGGPLVLADDALLRDVARIGRHHRPGERTRRAGALMVEMLARVGAKEVVVLLDRPLPRSGELAGWLRQEITRAGLRGTARAVAVPETELAGAPGLVASSDRVVVDRAQAVVDLGGIVAREIEPHPAIVRLWP